MGVVDWVAEHGIKLGIAGVLIGVLSPHIFATAVRLTERSASDLDDSLYVPLGTEVGAYSASESVVQQAIMYTYGGHHYCIDAAAWTQLFLIRAHPDQFNFLMAQAIAQGRCGITVEDQEVELWPPNIPAMAQYGAVIVVSTIDRMTYGAMGVNAPAYWIHMSALHEH